MKTRQEANYYYKLISELVDEYLDKWNINPINLIKYLKYGSNKYNQFLKRNKIENVPNIHIIINDILEDRKNEYLEMKNNESNNNITYEKLLADFYNSSIGHINNIGGNKFNIKDIGVEINCSIYSKDDLKQIRNKIINDIIQNINNNKIIHKFDAFTDDNLNNIDLKSSLNIENLKKELKNKYQTKTIVNYVSERDNMKFKKEYKGYFIFQK